MLAAARQMCQETHFQLSDNGIRGVYVDFGTLIPRSCAAIALSSAAWIVQDALHVDFDFTKMLQKPCMHSN